MLIKKSGGYEARDPWVVYSKGYFYHCFTQGAERIFVTKSATPDGLLTAEPVLVYEPEQGKEYSKELWAPELHVIDGKCYIYVACDDGDNNNHRMYVLENGSDDPQKTYRMHGKISDDTDKWAIDATIMHYKGKMYMVWSGWAGDENVCQDLYIAQMSDPFTICSKRVKISTPDKPWEVIGCKGYHPAPFINEGPAIYQKGDDVKIFYSGSSSWYTGYCVAFLTLVGEDPLDPKSWEKASKPALDKAEDGLNGPGHCSVTSDGKTDYIAFHVFDDGETEGWSNVHAEIHPFKVDGEKIILL
ncbi:MAG: glycoside hydrolase family 43 protein [Clostridia bacterium]|nr:glycoside hydrolase family 43 protein [Clostridia bacterium]